MALDTPAMLMVILMAAVVAPFLADRLSRAVAVPPVVVEVLLGVMIGAGSTPRFRGGVALALTPAIRLYGGRYWDRTSDLLGVNEALSR